MPEDKRLDFDAIDDLGQANNDLLKDVQEATKQVKQRKARDKARDAQIKTQDRDRTMIYIITAVAAVIILLAAYFLVFRGEATPGTPQADTENARPTTTYRPRQQQYAPSTRPTTPVAPSEPVRRTPADTYDEGSSGGGM